MLVLPALQAPAIRMFDHRARAGLIGPLQGRAATRATRGGKRMSFRGTSRNKYNFPVKEGRVTRRRSAGLPSYTR